MTNKTPPGSPESFCGSGIQDLHHSLLIGAHEKLDTLIGQNASYMTKVDSLEGRVSTLESTSRKMGLGIIGSLVSLIGILIGLIVQTGR